MRLHYRIAWLFLNFIEKAIFGFTVTGRGMVPRSGAVIIASNHISYCDPPVVGSGVPREVYFLAKEELFRNKAFGWLIKQYNAIPLKRASGDVGAFKKAVSLLKQGKAVLMFPEGTRSLSGRFLKPKAGVGMIAKLTSTPIVPVYVTGTNRLGSTLRRQAKLAVRFGEPVTPSAEEAPEAGGSSSQDEYIKISQEVMRRIADLAEEAD